MQVVKGKGVITELHWPALEEPASNRARGICTDRAEQNDIQL